jgi:hypothetical protein
MANIDTIARQVIRGNWGNGQARKDNLKSAGHSDSTIRAIQSRVNEILGVGQSASVAPVAPVAPAVDQGAIDRAAQAERDRQAAQAERDRLAKIEKDRLALIEKELLERLQKERLEAIARMPRPVISAPKESVKYANPGDVVEDINELPVDLILKLTLEKIGGMELLSLVRHDTVNGQNIIYRPIKNISQLAIEYNSQNLVKMPNSSDSYFKNFPIKLESHLPQTTNELPPLAVYIDPVTENVIIDLVNLKVDYEVEVQMVSSGKVFDGTIDTEDYS